MRLAERTLADGGARYQAFLVALGTMGWATLGAGAAGGFGPSPPLAPGAFLVFLGIIVAARSLAFHLVPRSTVSLDSAFYVAATVCLGSVPAGWLVASALSLDAGLRFLVRARRRELPREPLAYAFYFGGMTGALVLVCGWLVNVDALAGGRASQQSVLMHVAIIGVALLIAHYAIQGLRLAILGLPLRDYLRSVALPGMTAEATLLPLAVVVVYIYQPAQLLGLVLLGVTYLLINFVFNRMWAAGVQLRRRVSELETLSITSRRLASSLQLHELVDTIARETARAIPGAELVALAHGVGERDNEALAVDFYDRERDVFDRIRVARDTGATGWILEHGQSLVIDDVRRAPWSHKVPESRDARARSWMGVPITMYGQTRAVLSTQSLRIAAFAAEERRLLESLATLVGSALQNAHLYELAMVDGLTGLFVRRYLDARLDEEIERARRYGTEFSLVMLDIDDFKALNDTHGHPVGDRALRRIAEVIRQEMRAVDTAARYGGEEIAMILPRTAMLSAYHQAERIRCLIEELRIVVESPTAPTEVIAVTASLGIASYPESGMGGAEDLVRRADQALYRAKRTGKNRVELYWSESEAARVRSV